MLLCIPVACYMQVGLVSMQYVTCKYVGIHVACLVVTYKLCIHAASMLHAYVQAV